jgi:hypothetical protein
LKIFLFFVVVIFISCSFTSCSRSSKVNYSKIVPQIDGLPEKSYYRWQYLSKDKRFSILHYIYPIQGWKKKTIHGMSKIHKGLLVLVDQNYRWYFKLQIDDAFKIANVVWDGNKVKINHTGKEVIWNLPPNDRVKRRE